MPGALEACGSSASQGTSPPAPDGGSRDAGADAPLDTKADTAKPDTSQGPFKEAEHAPFPQVIYQGGGVIAAPQLVTVTFPGDTLASELVLFGDQIESSPYWTSVTAGYCAGKKGPCVGKGTGSMAAPYPMPPSPSYTDTGGSGSSTLQKWLVDSIKSGDLPPPQAGAISNTLYLLYFPASIEISLDGAKSCSDYLGYHGSATYGSQQIPYAVISECSGASAGESPPITTLENTTITAAHEILEASTDPSNLATGYYMDFNDTANWGWMDVQGGGEVADLCIDAFYLRQDEWPIGSFLAQRIWSNANAAAGHDPCNPIPTSEVYFNAAPKQSFFVMNVGDTLMFEVDAFSTAAREDWTLAAQDWDYSKTSYLDFSIVGGTNDKTLGSSIKVNNGSKIQVKMTLLKDPGDLYTYEADGAIVSVAGPTDKPTAATFWPFAVMTPADAVDSGIDAAVSSSSRMRGERRAPRGAGVVTAGMGPGRWPWMRNAGTNPYR